MKLVPALIVACTACCQISTGRPLDPPFGFVEPPDGITAIALPNKMCRPYTSCPAGVKLINSATGGLMGCTLQGTGATCNGDCQICTGSGAAVSLCVDRNGDSCLLGAPGGAVTCGTINTQPCLYSAAIKLPVKCDCTGLVTVTSDACALSSCI